MEDAIIEAIANFTPFGYDEIKLAHDILQSWDLTIAVCNLAIAEGKSVNACARLLAKALER